MSGARYSAGATRSIGVAAEWWFVLLCATPWLLLLGVYGEAAIAAVLLSHWPRPSADDPMSLSTAPLHLLNLVLVVFTFSALPTVAVIFLANATRVLRSTQHLTWLGVFACGLGLLAILVQADPGSVWYWHGD